MDNLNLKVPPVVVVLLLGNMMWIMASLNAWASLHIPAKETIAIIIGLIGSVPIVMAAAQFRAAKTTFNPLTPELATSMVTNGIYRFSRNPMYLGFLIILGAWGVLLENGLAITLMPVFIGYMNQFQIIPEEKALMAQFGGDYKKYLDTTARWL